MNRFTSVCGLILLLFTSCKIPISKEQEKIIAPFNVGDTLIFASTNQLKDTIIICGKGRYFKDLNPIFGNTFRKPEDAFVKFYYTKYYVKYGRNAVNDLVYIHGGLSSGESTKIFIEMRAFYCFLSVTSNDLGKKIEIPLKVNGKIYNEYYILTPDCSECPVEKDSCDIMKLYWDLNSGPFKYIDVRKETWTRIK